MGVLATVDRITSDATFLQEQGRCETATALLMIAAGASLEDAFSLHGTWIAIIHRRAQDRALQLVLEALPRETSCRSTATVVRGLLLAFRRTDRPTDRTGVRAALDDYLAAHGSTSIEWLRKSDVVKAWVSKANADTHASR